MPSNTASCGVLMSRASAARGQGATPLARLPTEQFARIVRTGSSLAWQCTIDNKKSQLGANLELEMAITSVRP